MQTNNLQLPTVALNANAQQMKSGVTVQSPDNNNQFQQALSREIDQRQAASNADNAPKAIDKAPTQAPVKQAQAQAPAKQAAKKDDSGTSNDSDNTQSADASAAPAAPATGKSSQAASDAAPAGKKKDDSDKDSAQASADDTVTACWPWSPPSIKQPSQRRPAR